MMISNRFWLAIGLIGLAAVTSSVFGAVLRFDIPQQKASAALVEFAKQAKVEVLFSFTDLDAVQGCAVVGNFEPEKALAILLRGSGFSAQLDEGKFIITRAPRPVARGAIRGRIISTNAHEPIADAQIRVVGSTARTVSGDHGEFELSGVASGTYTLGIQLSGYTSLRIDDVKVPSDDAMELGMIPLRRAGVGPEEMEELVLSASSLKGESYRPLSLEKVVVTPSRFGMAEERSGATATLTQQDLLALPQLADDLYRTISHLPGLAAADFTARFWVRGAPQEQVQSRFDGVDLIEPFHAKDTDGTFSIVDLASIGSLDLYTGGFTAEYGGRMAGVLNLESERYTGAGTRTSLGVSYIGANLANRGVTMDGRLRWLVSGRIGLLAHALKADKENGDPEIRPTFYDLTAKLEYDISPDQLVSLHLLHATDRMTIIPVDRPELHSSYGSDYLWGRWQGKIGSGLSQETVLAYTRLRTKRDGFGLKDSIFPVIISDKKGLDQWSFRQDWAYAMSERVLLRSGFEYKNGEANYTYTSERERPVFAADTYSVVEEDTHVSLNPSGNNLGAYIAGRVQPIPALTAEAGIRYDHNNYAGGTDVSPRLTAAYTFAATTLRAAWGLYHQAEGLQDLPVENGEQTFHVSEQAEHRILSLEQKLGHGVNLRLEAYQRIVSHPAAHWENVYGSLNTFPEIEDDRVRLSPTGAEARGLEFVAERRSGSKFLWSGSYAWAKTEETLMGGLTIPRARDQRQTVYLDCNYVPNRKWLFSVAWQYHTGWVVTERILKPYRNPQGGLIWSSTPGALFGLRLPAYQRLDLRMQRRFFFGRSELHIYLDVFNALNQVNIASYRYALSEQNGVAKVERRNGDKLFPIVPNIGALWEF